MSKRLFFLFLRPLFFGAPPLLPRTKLRKQITTGSTGSGKAHLPEAGQCKWNSKWMKATRLKDQATSSNQEASDRLPVKLKVL